MATADYRDSAGLIEIPPSAYTLEGFTEWTYSEAFPEQGRITFVDGRILIDMSPERYESHSKIKAVIYGVLVPFIYEQDLGEFYPDGARFKNESANISNEPDALFASWQTLESGKLTPPPFDVVPEGQHIDLCGSPDWVCEVLSNSSVTKDKKLLLESYHKASIPEYWLIDARGDEIDFQILVWQTDGYVAVNDEDDWNFSPVFDRHFQMTRDLNRVGRWRYHLKIR
ncbi:MAG: Uma2 family endonuclease [Planctomycetota bacterium]